VHHALVFILALVGVLNIVDRQIINILAQDIKTSLVINDGELGLLTGTSFGVFYAILGIPLGRLADRVDRFRLIAVSLALWSACTALCGISHGFSSLFLGRMGVGVGEAGSQPASTALIADVVPRAERNRAMSLLLMSIPVGSFLGLTLGGYVGAHWGWRTAFLCASAPGIALAALMLLTRPALHLRSIGSTSEQATDDSAPPAVESDRIAKSPGERRLNPLLEDIRQMLERPRFRWLIVAMTASTFLVYASSAWLPLFLIRVHGFDTATTGLYTAIAVGLGGGFGTLAAGALCDRLRDRVIDIEAKLLMVLFALCIPIVLATTLTPNRALAVIFMSLYNVCAYGWLSPTVTLIQDAAPAESRSLAIAICSTAASILSLGLGVPLVGALSDRWSTRLGPGSIGAALALSITVAALLGLEAHRRARRDREPNPVTISDPHGRSSHRTEDSP